MRVAMFVLPVLMASCTLVSGIGEFTVGQEGELTPGEEAGPQGGDSGGNAAEGSTSGDGDTSHPDTGTPESGTPDSGTPDSSKPDSSKPDTGAPDTGSPDTGTPIVDAGKDVVVTDPGPPALLQSKNASGSSSSLTLPLTATKTGSLIVLGIGRDRRTITSISDNAPGGSNNYVRAGVGTQSDCAGNEIGAEIWYAKNVKSGTTSVTVSFSGSAPAQIWGLELSKMDLTAPLDESNSTNNGGLSTSLNAATVTPSVADSVVVSTGVCCSTITSLKSGSPFTGMPVLAGNSTAYLLANKLGTYGASWNTDNCVSASTTAAFK
jgi:hypothetical protein